jgi:hypothetical protein
VAKGTSAAKPKPPGTGLGAPPKIAGSGSGAGSGVVPNPKPASNPPPSLGAGPTGSAVGGGTTAGGATGFQNPAGSMPNGNNFGGFAGRYSPGGVGQLYEDPSIISDDVLYQMGFGGNRALQAQLGDVAQIAPALAFLMNVGGGKTNIGDEDMINTMGAMLRQQGTTGGQAIDYKSLLGNILGAGPDDQIRAYTSLDAAGNPLSGGDQQSALMGLLSAALGNVNPFSQRAMMGQAGAALQDWRGELAQGMTNGAKQGTALDYLRKTGLLNQYSNL